MNAPRPSTCPRCGAVLPEHTDADAVCPACLLSGALHPTAGGEATVPLSEEPAAGGRPPPLDLPCDFGPYRLVRLLGRGGMGTVYEAVESATGRRLALKQLGRALDTADMRRRFLREGRLAAGVTHPNSLYVFGSEEINGQPVITMEMAAGGTLQDRLDARGPLPPAEAVDAILDVIAGLEAAQTAGVLHRDVKPSNCFVCPDGSIKIGDFGLSVSTEAGEDTFVTGAGAVMGTPAFASPEQLRGDSLDLRADIYSVGATLYALLTGRPPFEGANAVQVVANAVNQRPRPPGEWRGGLDAGLERVVLRCLAKDPDHRYGDYPTFRKALLPYSSRTPLPASLKVRLAAGWADFLIAFLPAYLVLMATVGAEDLLLRPIVERTLHAWRYYAMLLACGTAYFTVMEGIDGAGFGKRLKGLRVVGRGNRPPGMGRALVRILAPIGCMEGIRIPLTMAFIPSLEMTGGQVGLFVATAIGCAYIPVLLLLTARRDNGFATGWDLLSGTRVQHAPQESMRPPAGAIAAEPPPAADGSRVGPYQVGAELSPGQWLSGVDPVLRRPVWLLRRGEGDALSPARRALGRPTRLRWLQSVDTEDATWDVFEAPAGAPVGALADPGRPADWADLRWWLHDLAEEIHEASRDGTLPDTLRLSQVWITADGRAILLERPWPGSAPDVDEPIPVGDLAGRQRFLARVAALVDRAGLPLHARPVLRNLDQGSFERISFAAGTLRGLLARPVGIPRSLRAGSIFMLPAYAWVLTYIGVSQGAESHMFLGSLLAVLAVFAAVQLAGVAVGSTPSHAVFRLAVVDRDGVPAGRPRLLLRWAAVWVPLLPAMLLAGASAGGWEPGAAQAIVPLSVVLWLGAAVYAAAHPGRGLQDRVAGTRVVRR